MHHEFPVSRLLDLLRRDNLLPAILFRTARKQCDADIEKLQNDQRAELGLAAQEEIHKAIESIIDKYKMERTAITGHPHYETLMLTGVGAHHAGQLLLWRLLLEELMTRGRLRMMIATGTVAAGVDFPARTVVITAHSRRSSEGFSNLSPSEFQQMAGRAGRRGRDAVGICLIAPSRFSDARVLHRVAAQPPDPLRSAYFAAPATVLNLLKYRNVDDLHYTVSKSLASFHDRREAIALRHGADEQEAYVNREQELSPGLKAKLLKRVRRMRREADDLEQKQETALNATLTHLERLGHLSGGSLTEKGYWAAQLCTTLVLELAEAVDTHLLTDLKADELVMLLATISGDAHRSYLPIRKNPVPPERLAALTKILQRVKDLSPSGKLPYETQVVPDAAATIAMWMQSQSWEEFSSILRFSGVAEGDVARLVSQTADHLNQLSRIYDTHTELARAAIDGRRLILKPPLTEAIPVE
jgi:superfamily II RNA helicase